jgi:hypothetical protein
MNTIDLTPDCTIEDAAIAVVTTANHTGQECRAKFNGFDLVAHPLVTDEEDLIRAYWQHRAAVHDGIIVEALRMMSELLANAMLRELGTEKYDACKQIVHETLKRVMARPDIGDGPLVAAVVMNRAAEVAGDRMAIMERSMLFIAAMEVAIEKAEGPL